MARPSTSVRADRVVAAFGYAENGAETNYYCTSRQEACYAVGATFSESNPFEYDYEVDSDSGVECASGCTVRIPTIPGRVTFYKLMSNNAGVLTDIPGTASVVGVP